MLLRAYAKINLSLEIEGKRPNGYHDLYSLMQGIGLYDEITFDVIDGADNAEVKDAAGIKCNTDNEGIVQNSEQFSCRIGATSIQFCLDCDTIPAGRDNLAIRGMEAVFASLPADAEIPAALRVEIRKMLPVAAGIAGGSGNAAVSMLAVNALTGSKLTLRELMEIGIKVGSDVPFSLLMNAKMNADVLRNLRGLEEASAAAYISGIGEIVEPAEPLKRWVIMMNPGIAVSTKEAYEAIDSLPARVINHDLFYNILEEYTLEQYEGARELKDTMREKLRADQILMSGSGPTIVAYYEDGDVAKADYEGALSSDWVKDGWRIWITETGAC